MFPKARIHNIFVELRSKIRYLNYLELVQNIGYYCYYYYLVCYCSFLITISGAVGHFVISPPVSIIGTIQAGLYLRAASQEEILSGYF